MPQRQAGTRPHTLSRWVIGATVLLGAAAAPGAATSSSDRLANLSPTVREQPLTQYRAYRRMHAGNEHFGQEAWLEAWTEFDVHYEYETINGRPVSVAARYAFPATAVR